MRNVVRPATGLAACSSTSSTRAARTLEGPDPIAMSVGPLSVQPVKALEQIRYTELVSTVQLYNALGGGWE